MTGDGGAWLRTQYMIMAQNTYTPIPYWADMPLSDFREWMDTNNDIVNSRKKN